jgi:predicted N-formylglutamate amidohydrolase
MLLPHEPAPFEVVRPEGSSRVLLVCDHASKRIPEALGSLGVSEADRATHIGWDIGAALVAQRMSELLDATLVLAGYSRLAFDCNRPPHVPSAMPAVSGGIPIPGNEGLDEASKLEREEALFRPYHEAISRIVDDRVGDPQREPPVLLSIHSFTPELLGQKRPWPVAVLYGRDVRLAHAFRDALERDPKLLVGDNEPYHVTDLTDYTLPIHGEARHLLHTAFEIRQDGLLDEPSAHAWAERLVGIWRELEPKLAQPPFA